MCSFQKNRKECKECCVLFKRTEKNVKNVAFFSKDRKRTQEFCVLLKRMRAQPCLLVLSVLPFPPFLSALTVLLDLPTHCPQCPHCPPRPPWSACTVPADLFIVLPVTGLTSPHTSKASGRVYFTSPKQFLVFRKSQIGKYVCTLFSKKPKQQKGNVCLYCTMYIHVLQKC